MADGPPAKKKMVSAAAASGTAAAAMHITASATEPRAAREVSSINGVSILVSVFSSRPFLLSSSKKNFVCLLACFEYGRQIATIVQAMGASSYHPQVVPQLLEFVFRLCASLSVFSA